MRQKPPEKSKDSGGFLICRKVAFFPLAEPYKSAADARLYSADARLYSADARLNLKIGYLNSANVKLNLKIDYLNLAVNRLNWAIGWLKTAEANYNSPAAVSI